MHEYLVTKTFLAMNLLTQQSDKQVAPYHIGVRTSNFTTSPQASPDVNTPEMAESVDHPGSPSPPFSPVKYYPLILQYLFLASQPTSSLELDPSWPLTSHSFTLILIKH